MRLLLFVACVLALGGCGLFDGVATAEKAAVVFHEQYNAGRFGEIYDDSSDGLRSAAARNEFMTTIAAIREKLGLIRGTERTAFNARVDSRGTFVELEYETDFENGAGTEAFRWEITDGRARLLSYNLTSNALLR